MVKKFLVNIAVNAAKDPEKSSGVIIKVILCISMFFVLLSSVALGMVSSFAGSNKYLNDEFKVEEEEIYKNIETAYLEFESEMQGKMAAREAEIIAEHTETVETDEGDQSVCNVTVAKQFATVNYAYAFAYINHKYPVKEGGTYKYKFDKKEIKEFFENIALLKEYCAGTNYKLVVEVMKPEEVAELYFTEDDDKQMYAVSYELYTSFLKFSNTGDTDSDMGDGNGSPGYHYTYISPDEEETVLNNCDDEIGKKVVEFAMSKLGYPYSQARRDDGAHFDCSSLCFYAYQSVGITLMSGSANTAAAIANYCATNNQTVSYDQLQPGDLIFYCCSPGNGRFMGIDHVAIYAGNGKIIDASSSKGYVVYRNVFWRDRIVLCGRPR